MSKPRSKPGPYGTLYLHELEYTDAGDGGCPHFKMRKWAYDIEAVYTWWSESNEDDGDWLLLGVKRVMEE